MKTRTAIALICSMLVCAAPGRGWGQTNRLQQVEKQLAERHVTSEAHRKQMESIKDPDKLTTAMQRHFQMTEEIIALMLERRQLAVAQIQPSRSGSGSGSSMQGGGMGAMEREMENEAGGMHGEGGMGRGMMEREMGRMGGSGTSGRAGSKPRSGPAAESNEIKQMMQRIVEHSAYMETIKDRAQLGKEMLRHQKMLDQMLQLMQ